MALPETNKLHAHYSTNAAHDDSTSKLLTLRRVYEFCGATKQWNEATCSAAIYAMFGALETCLVTYNSHDVVETDLSQIAQNKADKLINWY